MSADASQAHREGQQVAAPAAVASVPTVDAAAVLASHTRREWLHWQPDDDGTGLEQYRRIGCAVCGEDWNTGGCPAALLAREVVALRERVERAGRELEIEEANRIEAVDWAIHERQLRVAATARVALLEGLLRDLAAKGEAMKEALFTGDDNREAIACMEWDDAVAAALADGG